MLTRELINKNIPRLQLQDTVGKALQLINDFRISHLPVVADDKFLGLVSEDDLLDAKNEKLTIEFLQDTFLNAAVKGDVHQACYTCYLGLVAISQRIYYGSHCRRFNIGNCVF